jgi:3-oxoacyl-[acyl-carrier protein] reductase
MDLGLSGKVAIVAASSQGLGKAVALELGREGANLTMCSRSEENLMAAAKEISAQTKANILALPADVTKPQDIDKLVEKTVERFGRIDIVINNAGGPPLGGFESFNDEEWAKALEMNLLSIVRLVRTAVPYLKKSEGGRIINITSVAVKQPLDGLVLSNTARAGVQGLTKTLANELGRFNITVNSVLPGLTETARLVHNREFTAKAQGRTPEEVKADQEKSVPLQRLGQPHDLAAAVAFLASDRASYITGQALLVDGGMYKGLM